MEGKNNEVKISSHELLHERLHLTLAFCKRYHMSAAVCYLRANIPLELLNQKSLEIETSLLGKMDIRLNRSVRDIDTVIRVNSTDFIIVIVDITEYDCQQICERIIGAIAEKYTADFHQVVIHSHMGICMYPYGAEGPQELMDMAKMQMYEAEKAGKNSYSFYKGELNKDSYRKMLIENDLPYALKKGQLYVRYQPQYHLKNRKITGSEALIRWNHPILGEIAPDEFIHFAEKAGVIHSLFYWTFAECCKNIASQKSSELKYSINISVNQLLLDHFLQEISTILTQYAVTASQITFEITENIELYTVKRVNERLQALRELGFSIALDDFGNGYFSFTDFIKFPINYLKLDRNFVSSLMKNKKHSSVISPIINMAHNLGLQVIVEGIEDNNQFLEWSQLEVISFKVILSASLYHLKNLYGQWL